MAIGAYAPVHHVNFGDGCGRGFLLPHRAGGTISDTTMGRAPIRAQRCGEEYSTTRTLANASGNDASKTRGFPSVRVQLKDVMIWILAPCVPARRADIRAAQAYEVGRPSCAECGRKTPHRIRFAEVSRCEREA